ncbi:tripartite tricarboxylate transporter TctB family protein [Rossellomorea vietnamensis]|uniref:Tripartite tricarboxylate transporter TctB family protein n=1 Tax=Rossellomorea vietnamensis TaxID=218284 RepID=A0ACD4CBY7_9BACI|nr:tripartite tricarboxylate transporter TctB family protein [Rossellomorea vietnamensis]UXH46028.1 tripartite tricarboxylate transporter TctB family protein [Rossellomorea vietnamensis]WQI97435.1 tripartite tricarboxylate transporter TctB family protein [Rossellomorea vietnamensis]
MRTKPDRIISLVLLVFAVVYLALSYRLPAFPYAVIDSDVLPKGLGYLLIILAIVLFLQAKDDTDADKERRYVKKEDLIILLSVLAALLIYIFLLEPVGFLLSTILFLLVIPFVLGFKKKVTTVLVAFLFSGVMYYSFNYLLNITLPQGILPF